MSRTEITKEAIRAILGCDSRYYDELEVILGGELENRGLTQSGPGWEENWFTQRREALNDVVDWMIRNTYLQPPPPNMLEDVRLAFRGMIFHMRRRSRERVIRTRRRQNGLNADTGNPTAATSQAAVNGASSYAAAQTTSLTAAFSNVTISRQAQTITRRRRASPSPPSFSSLSDVDPMENASRPLPRLLPYYPQQPAQFPAITPPPLLPQPSQGAFAHHLTAADFQDDGITEPATPLRSLRILVTNENDGRTARMTYGDLAGVNAHGFDYASLDCMWRIIANAMPTLTGRRPLIFRRYRGDVVMSDDVVLDVWLREAHRAGVQEVRLSMTLWG